MSDTIEEFENEIYCVMRSVDSARPVIQESWYPTGLNAYSMRHSYGEDFIGKELKYDQGFYFRTPNGGRLRVETTSKYSARYVEVPITPPKSRLPVEWRQGHWWKETKRGWVPWYR